MRDKRFVAEHRGGPLNKAQHRQLIKWACVCVGNVLPLSGEKTDWRVKQAIEVAGKWEKVIENIKYLSTKTYVSVGIVVTNENIERVCDTILFAHDLGVADIRVIPAAQFTRQNTQSLSSISEDVLNAHPILKYRVNRALLGHSVRGISKSDSHKCYLVLDDSVIAGNSHYPCVIYMREMGAPIGKVGENMREERAIWSAFHNCYDDAICRNNCLDVCIDYNNAYKLYHSDMKKERI